MTILHLSDTHSQHRQLTNLPEADVIVHSGDITATGTDQEVKDFIDWFVALPYKHKIFIAGNHDHCLLGKYELEGLPDNVHYLYHSGVEIDGVYFWGRPMLMEERVSSSVYRDSLDLMPMNTDVLVSHEAGYDELLYAENMHIPYVLCGHEHNQYGIRKYKGVMVANASIVDDDNRVIHPPLLLHI